MILQNYFSKDPMRPIDGVIKADDKDHLAREIREYIITDDIRTKLHDHLLESYVDTSGKTNGVWISGFYGSGKSHLLKMLSLVLPNQQLADDEGELKAGDHFLEKASEDPMLQGLLRRAINIPSESILFNIDSVGTSVGKDSESESAVLAAFLKVFNDQQGYYGAHPYIAQFERDLDEEGMLDTFKQHYLALSGKDWELGRTRLLLGARHFEEAFAKTRGIPPTEAVGKLKEYRTHTKVNIEAFAQLVAAYLRKNPAIERLNFFVDEVGQYISDNTKLMTNLQTVAENLYTATRGKAWVFVTSQQAIDKLIGDLNKTQEQDFSKIQGRFKCKLTLDSKSVNEVVERRLLEKTDEATQHLKQRFTDGLQNKLASTINFPDGGAKSKGYEDADHFARVYPFAPYQFDLFKRALEQLSIQQALLGLHISVGERSLLSAAQNVLKKRFASGASDKGECLVGFDRMYAGIEDDVRSEASGSLQTAEKSDVTDLAKRALRALFLVKFVNNFKATLRHVSVLLYENPDQDFAKHQKDVREALAELEHQNFVQRKGADEFEFLTQEEQVIEKEIKNESATVADIQETLQTFVFNEVLNKPKFIYSGNKKPYTVERVFDDKTIGRSHELKLHVTTQFHDQAGNVDIQAASTQNRPEIRVIVPADNQLREDLQQYYKTDRYITKNPPATADTKQKKRILEDQGSNNNDRKFQLIAQVKKLLLDADIIVSGSRVSVSGGNAADRIAGAFDILVEKAYRELNLVKIKDAEHDLEQSLIGQNKSDLFKGDAEQLTAAESAVLGKINSIQTGGNQVTLHRIVDEFSKRPYGWAEMDTAAIVGRLVSRRVVDTLVDGEELDDAAAYKRLKSSHGKETVVLRPQDNVDPSKQAALRRLHKALFDAGNKGTDIKEIREHFKQGLEEQLQDIRKLLREVDTYPFLAKLKGYEEALDGFWRKPASEYFELVKKMEDALLDDRDEVLRPIKNWMVGTGKSVYDEAQKLLRVQKPNEDDFGAEGLLNDVLAIVGLDAPYRSKAMDGADEALRKTKNAIADRLKAEREQTKQVIRDELAHLEASHNWAALDEGKQNHYREELDKRARSVEDKDTIAAIQRLRPNMSPEWYSTIESRIEEAVAKTRNATTPIPKVNPVAETSHTATPASTTPPTPSTAPQTEPAKTAIKKTIMLSHLLRSTNHSRLRTPDQIDEYLQELKTRLLKELDKNGAISVR